MKDRLRKIIIKAKDYRTYQMAIIREHNSTKYDVVTVPSNYLQFYKRNKLQKHKTKQ